MNTEIRPVQPEDIPEAVRVIQESFATVAEDFRLTRENAPRFTAFAVTEEQLRWQMEQEWPMSALVEDGRMVGYYALSPRDRGACELNHLCILPAYRHRGLGGVLLKHALVHAVELGFVRMTLGLVEENRVLRAWYEAYGFTHTGCKKFDFFPFTCGYMERPLRLP